MTLDLRTRYLGLRPRSPWWPSAWPLTAGSTAPRLAEPARRGRPAFLFEEQVEHAALAIAGPSTRPKASPRPSYFPDLDDYNTGPAPLPAQSRRQAQALDPRDREPQRHLAGRLDTLTPS